jgi:hypothetical protein
VNQLFAAPIQSLESDERYTPRWVFDGLGITFDLDPCSPGEGAGDCVPAVRKLTKHDDGLAHDWEGCVWVNPPFSRATEFGDRFIAHGLGVFLGPVANARWTHDMLNAADLVWLCRDFAFTHPTHAGKRSSMPLMFCAIGNGPKYALRRLALSGVHPGVLLAREEAS